jgi:hypothetical protein
VALPLSCIPNPIPCFSYLAALCVPCSLLQSLSFASSGAAVFILLLHLAFRWSWLCLPFERAMSVWRRTAHLPFKSLKTLRILFPGNRKN